MPNITEHHSREITKLLFIGDSGTGKTGALASLAAANYKVRIIDTDDGVDILKDYLTNPASMYVKQLPDCAKNLDYITLTDPMRNSNGKLIPVRVTVWQRAMQLLMQWKDGGTDLGKISDWGPDTVLVIDSLSSLSTAALNFHLAINGLLGASRTQNEWRRDIGQAQELLRTFLSLINDSSLKCNIILTAHVTLVNEVGGKPEAMDVTTTKGYPSAIGRALSPHIPRSFNTVLFADTVGSGAGTRHRIYTRSQGVVNVKNTAPLRVAPEYPLETGLADYFKAVRSQ